MAAVHVNDCTFFAATHVRQIPDLSAAILCLCFVSFAFLSTPVPEVAGIGHSGRYPKTRQYKLLENYPEDQEPD